MKVCLTVLCITGLMTGCGGGGGSESAAPTERGMARQKPLIQVEPPAPLEAPEPMTVTSPDNWKAKINNKDIEIVEVLNVINPVAAYITAGFDQYGDRFSSVLREEWQDTQAQLTSAMTLYEDCKKRTEAGDYDKQLFLDMENVWQLLVKTGVAGVRTKSMVDAEVTKLTGS